MVLFFCFDIYKKWGYMCMTSKDVGSFEKMVGGFYDSAS